jgi:hypothetical protein
MGYFKGIAGMYFKKAAGGKTVFFPWGAFAKGYTLADEPLEARVRGFIKLHLIVSLPVLVLAVNYSWTWFFIAVAASYAWFYLKTRALLSGCAVSAEKLTFKESYANSGKAHNKLTLWLLFVASLLFVAVSAWFTVFGPGGSNKLPLAFSGLFFGACAVAIGYMLWSRGRAARR